MPIKKYNRGHRATLTDKSVRRKSLSLRTARRHAVTYPLDWKHPTGFDTDSESCWYLIFTETSPRYFPTGSTNEQINIRQGLAFTQSLYSIFHRRGVQERKSRTASNGVCSEAAEVRKPQTTPPRPKGPSWPNRRVSFGNEPVAVLPPQIALPPLNRHADMDA